MPVVKNLAQYLGLPSTLALLMDAPAATTLIGNKTFSSYVNKYYLYYFLIFMDVLVATTLIGNKTFSPYIKKYCHIITF